MDNPFIYRTYKSKELFCDRESELQTLLGHCTTNADTTLISQRRIGKTGLIHRLFEEIRDKNLPIVPIYVDIFATRSLQDFIKTLSEAVLTEITETPTFGQRIQQFIHSLRPLVTFDPISGAPQLQINYQTEPEKEQTLKSLLTLLDQQDKRVLIAIDEFQQIRNYDEQNVEALLRSYIQQLNNVTFIFCGSKRHLMLDIFSNEKKPFYRNTEFLELGKIAAASYGQFIAHHFSVAGKSISAEAIEYILSWTNRHTYFTQRLCHHIFNMDANIIGIEEIKLACLHILQADTVVYNQYRQMLTNGQWNLLIAIAKEGSVTQITSKAFLTKYHLGSASSVQRTVKALIEKDLLMEDFCEGTTTYSLGDIFLSHWLESKY